MRTSLPHMKGSSYRASAFTAWNKKTLARSVESSLMSPGEWKIEGCKYRADIEASAASE